MLFSLSSLNAGIRKSSVISFRIYMNVDDTTTTPVHFSAPLNPHSATLKQLSVDYVNPLRGGDKYIYHLFYFHFLFIFSMFHSFNLY